MAIFTVQTSLRHPDGTPKQAYVESDHASIGELIAALRQGPVLCQKITASYDRDTNKMMVKDRRDFAIGSALIASVELANLPFVEAAA